MDGLDIASRIEAFRTLRAEIEASVLPLATSLDGRRFSLQSAVQNLSLRLGGYTMLEGDGEPALGQLRSLGLAEIDTGEVGLPTSGNGPDVRSRVAIRIVRGEGAILQDGVGPFHDRLARPAAPEEVRSWLDGAAPTGARLEIGTLPLAGGIPAHLAAAGFDRHTFLCGQSGSGKSYSLGLVLEQLLLTTDLRIVIVDPNSDFARLRETRDEADPDTARALAGGRGRGRGARRGRRGRRAAAAALRRPGERHAGRGPAPRSDRRPRGVRGPRGGARASGSTQSRGPQRCAGPARREPRGRRLGRVGAQRRGVAARRARRPRRPLPRRRHRLAGDARGAGARGREPPAQAVGAQDAAPSRAAGHRRGPQRVPRAARTIRSPGWPPGTPCGSRARGASSGSTCSSPASARRRSIRTSSRSATTSSSCG